MKKKLIIALSYKSTLILIVYINIKSINYIKIIYRLSSIYIITYFRLLYEIL